jgi:hypothetical protein
VAENVRVVTAVKGQKMARGCINTTCCSWIFSARPKTPSHSALWANRMYIITYQYIVFSWTAHNPAAGAYPPHEPRFGCQSISCYGELTGRGGRRVKP